MSEEKEKPKDLKYSVDEFFYDKSFKDYDEHEKEYWAFKMQEASKEAKRKCKVIGQNIQYQLNNKSISIEQFAAEMEIEILYAKDILDGNIDLDLRLLCKLEDYLQIKLVRWVWEV